MKFQNIIKSGVLVGAVVYLSGCNTISQPKYWGTRPFLKNDTVKTSTVNDRIAAVVQLEKSDIKNIPENTYKEKRNELQDYLKLVSNQNCNNYKGSSLFAQSNINFGLGSAATLLGAAGALTSGGLTQALSASAGAVTGVQAQVSQNYYREKTFEIITRAMDTRRKAVWADIENRRMQDATDQNYTYTIERAVADAIEYNGACSLIAGFEQLDDSVSMQEDAIDKTINEQKNMAEQAENNVQAVDKKKPIGRFRTIDEILAVK